MTKLTSERIAKEIQDFEIPSHRRSAKNIIPIRWWLKTPAKVISFYRYTLYLKGLPEFEPGVHSKENKATQGSLPVPLT